jgi:phosphotriesterase-related protein
MAIDGKIMTVNGPIDADDLGFVLTHEHVLVDFIGAEQAGKHRYDEDEAFAAILPHLEQAKKHGCTSFVECTPSYLGKDPMLLKRLAAATGMHLLTNTGYYGAANDRYVPAHAYGETADQLAKRWIGEFSEGMDGTGVRPGFIKIGVDPQPLSAIDEKLVRAAARAHRQTGLTIMSHTSLATPAHEEIAVLKEEGISPTAWIWTHAQNEADNEQHRRAAEQGAWIAFDGVNASPEELERDLKHLLAMKEWGLLDRVLLSHDAGWYRPGEAMGGPFRPFVDLFESLLPAMRERGFTDGELHLLTVENPRRAFAIQVRPSQ